jgi:WD40 repeat protein
LQKFEHPDVVTSVQFHPIRERFFVSGCFDGLVRVWDLIKEDKTEIASAEVNLPSLSSPPHTSSPRPYLSLSPQHTDLVTAVCFSPDGLYVAAGLIDGHVFLYETADLKYYTQIACIRKNKKLSARDKRKVTGVSFIASRGPSALVGGDLSTGSGGGGRRPVTTTKDKYHLLVTTNDSRIRLFSMSDFTLLLKLKGPTNSSRQIRASGSLDGRSIICGSDTGDVFIWKLPAHPSTPTTASAPAATTATEDSAVRIGSDGEAAAARVALPSLPLSPSSSLLVECHVIPAQLKTATLSVDLPSSAASSSAGTASSGKELYPPCTATLLVPLNAIHLSHTAAGHSNGSEDTTSSLRNASKITGAGSGSRYSAKDLSCLAILTAEYDGSLHVLYTPG